ncbi:hypothetical protein LR48_Vigan07g237900 [Vigna angularis]|uniref:Pentatricopeptide repeat-containing protein n=1 Tax=Phaseolus angularis TaxID=3914 RepID=A0A0L9V0M7_PHAAN|nr:hypothetical protein LR48_Vigan07g237900 [Vigna angularis]
MCRHGLVPDHVTLTTLLSGFTEFESVNEVAQVQTHVVKLGYDSTLKVCNSLLDSYCKTRSLGLVCHLFKHMPERDNVTFNVLLTGYSKEGFNHDAINLFSRCRIWGSIPLSLLLLLSTPNFVRSARPERSYRAFVLSVRPKRSYRALVLSARLGARPKRSPESSFPCCENVRPFSSTFRPQRSSPILERSS